jgi:alkyl hydroperoxide reductase subunit AhpC
LAALEADHARFEEANAQVLGVSVDSVYSHRAFAEQLGGISFPILADFHPKGEVARRYGVWREENGNSRRAVFIIDKNGTLRWSKVYERGNPDNEELLTVIQGLNASE